MIRYNMERDGKFFSVLEISTMEDLEKYIDYATELAMVEFRALLTLDDRGETHNRWKSPITNIVLRMEGMGKSFLQSFADNTDAYIDGMKKGFREHGLIRINGAGGYCGGTGINISDYVSKEEINEVPTNIIYIEPMCKNLILENDDSLDEELVDYMKENDLKYSSVTSLRLAVKNGELNRALGIIIDHADGYNVNLYIKTSGLDIDQIENLMEKLNWAFKTINYMIPEEKQYLIEELSQKYPKIKFNDISELSKV